MPGGSRELTNTADFPPVASIVGDEIIPAANAAGVPVGIPANLLRTGGKVFRDTWAELLLVTAAAHDTAGRVDGPDAGTHTDPVTLEAGVDNEGEYVFVVGDPGGWRRRADNADVDALTADVAAVEAGQAAQDVDIDLLKGVIDADFPSTTDDQFWFVDASVPPKILARIDKEGRFISHAAGSSISDTADDGPFWGAWYLRQWRVRRRKLMLNESTSIPIVFLGDSYLDNGTRWTTRIADYLTATYGDAGDGWFGFGVTNANKRTGTSQNVPVGWTNNDRTDDGSPDASSVTWVSGAAISFTGHAGHTSAILYYHGGSHEIRYRWNGGAWTNLSLAGSGLLTASLTGVPAGAFTCEIERVSGTPTLCGADMISSADGVRVIVLANSGGTTADWTEMTEAEWVAGMTVMAPLAAGISLGTNDQKSASAISPGQYALNLVTMYERLRMASPTCGVFFMPPPENAGDSHAAPMVDYQAAAKTVAIANGCGFVNTQHAFGDDIIEYEDGSDLDWFADELHPDTVFGGVAIADYVLRFLE